MNETQVCVVGNVATQPVFRELPTGASARFRLAVTARYLDREKGVWTDGHTNFFTVWANRQLAANVTASLSVGDPVLVQGKLKIRTETRDGQSRTSADIDAVTIGHDLARGTAVFRRTGRTPDPGPGPGAGHEQGPEPDWATPAPTSPSAPTPSPTPSSASASASASAPAQAEGGAVVAVTASEEAPVPVAAGF